MLLFTLLSVRIKDVHKYYSPVCSPELQARQSTLYSVQWLRVCVSAISTEKCVSACQWLIAVLAQQLWGCRPHCDVSVAMETVGRGRGLDKDEERERGRWWREIAALGWEGGKILDLCLRVFIHSLCVGMPPVTCVCASACVCCRVKNALCCRGAEGL